MIHPSNLNAVGDSLPDGSVVISKDSESVLLVSPHYTELEWNNPSESGFLSLPTWLKHKGFDSSEWFVPSINQLLLAFKVSPSSFPPISKEVGLIHNKHYWSRETDDKGRWGVTFPKGCIFQSRYSKGGNETDCRPLLFSRYVRTFRLLPLVQ